MPKTTFHPRPVCYPGAAQSNPLFRGSCHARLDPFTDCLQLEFRERPKDIQKQPSHRAVCVNRFPDAY